jgi:hypothetical protein
MRFGVNLERWDKARVFAFVWICKLGKKIGFG